MRYLRAFCYLAVIVVVAWILVLWSARTTIWYVRFDLSEGSTRVADLFKDLREYFPDSAKMDFKIRVEGLKARGVQDRAVRILSVAQVPGGNIPIDRLYRVESLGKSRVVRVTVHADSCAEAVAVANALREAAIEENHEADLRILFEARARAREWLKKPDLDLQMHERLTRFLASGDTCTDQGLCPLDCASPGPLRSQDAWAER